MTVTRIFSLLGGLVGLGLASGCSTPASRAEQHSAQVATWPKEVQEQVRAGRIGLGFTAEMVRVALGAPDRVFTRTTADGEAEVWVYFDQRPKFSFGLGVGSAGARSATAAGVTVGDDGGRDEEAMRVVFAAGKVSGIEQRKAARG